MELDLYLGHRTLPLRSKQRISRQSRTQRDRSSGDTVRLEEGGSDLRFSGLQVDPAEKIGEARVRAQRIEHWIHFNAAKHTDSNRTVLKTLFQPLESVVLFPEAPIDFGYG